MGEAEKMWEAAGSFHGGPQVERRGRIGIGQTGQAGWRKFARKNGRPFLLSVVCRPSGTWRDNYCFSPIQGSSQQTNGPVSQLANH